jgi:hypothetical protein
MVGDMNGSDERQVYFPWWQETMSVDRRNTLSRTRGTDLSFDLRERGTPGGLTSFFQRDTFDYVAVRIYSSKDR